LIQLEDKEIKRRFLLINSIRISVLLVFLIISVLSLLFQTFLSIIHVVVFIVISIIVSLFHFSISVRMSTRFSIYVQIFTDILIITGLVYFSGGVSSPFYFLYFLPILISAIFLSRRDTIYTAAFSYIVFGLTSDLIYMKVIRSFPGPFDFEITNENFIYNLIVSFIAFSFFAFISSYYFESLKRKGNELKSVRENLEDLILINNMVLERMVDGLIVSDSEGKIISYNEKAKIIFNLRDNSNILKIIGTKTISELRENIIKSHNRYIIELKKKTNYLEITISIIKEIYAFSEVFVLLISDLTTKRQIEEVLKQKEHFALIGEMSAGLAHEIRNPLASISGSIQYLQKDLSLKKETKNLMSIVVKESARLSDSIEEFLHFSKTSPLDKENFDLSLIVDEIIEITLLNSTDVHFRKRYSKGNNIFADKKKINQVIWNIVNNSIKSLGSNGSIEINIFKENSITALSVEDNGSGMRSEELAKIFIPFFSKFTTGIGLGMSIVKRVLDEHGFKIRINSDQKKGTEVTIWFKTE